MTLPNCNFIRSPALVLGLVGLSLGGCFRYGLSDQYYVNKGNLYMREGKRPDAVRVYKEAVELNPYNAVARNNLGVALSLGRNYEEAAAQLLRSVEIRADYKEAWNNLGAAYLSLLRLDEAHEAADKALSLDPNYIRPIRLRAKIFVAQGMSRKALRVYADYMKKGNEDFELRLAMGRLSSEIGLRDESVAHYRRAATLDPRSAIPHRELAQIYSTRKQFALANVEIELALEVDPADATLLFLRAEDEVRRRDDAAAIKTYRLILVIDAEYLKARGQEELIQESHRNLALLYERIEKYTLALFHWTELLKLNSQDTQAPNRIKALRISIEDPKIP